jgi:hypothetical protein
VLCVLSTCRRSRATCLIRYQKPDGEAGDDDDDDDDVPDLVETTFEEASK